ncbi:MAG: hypothetical protein MJA27_21790 [Pseudanabaenales cyanobacterium]|nr:hypothetical protein [Pseudanabaenales cyanobacterium]
MKQLQKAELISIEGGEDIEFMFNPNEISFSRSMSLEQAEGARTESGQNKTSFKHPNPYSLTINNIIFDTYETGGSVLAYLDKFSKAVKFATFGEGQNKRPPIYLFTWGANQYLRCFVKQLDFKLSLFLPDGTPVRASINLSLEQVEIFTPTISLDVTLPTAGQRRTSPDIFT